ncbi:MAG: heme-binding Shp domain-containing protein [Coriobacteriia bacterium]|mgnify:CR=1 FL=1|nr:heme-binding Shp domain-containing protein [Coriobacteriia bacterium]
MKCFVSSRRLARGVAATCFGLMAFVVALSVWLPLPAWAEELPCKSGVAHGSFEHPESGEIADSSGVVGKVIGQNMINKVVGADCLLEEGENTWLDLRFNMTNSISDISMQMQGPKDSDWTKTNFQVVSQDDDSADLRVLVSSAKDILKVSFYVTPIGRNVTFFVSCDSWKEGNAGSFARIPKDEEASLASAFGLDPAEPAKQSSSDADLVSSSLTASSGQGTQVAPGFWLTLFLTVFCAVFFAGAALMLVRHLLKPRR